MVAVVRPSRKSLENHIPVKKMEKKYLYTYIAMERRPSFNLSVQRNMALNFNELGTMSTDSCLAGMASNDTSMLFRVLPRII